jgi:predicted murein hydrolase (TIGR00659 family)
LSAASLAATPLAAILATLIAFRAGCWVNQRCNASPFANPVLIAILLIAAWLAVSGVSYEHYFSGAQLIHFLLGPATVALAIPLYDNFERIRASALSITVAVVAGASAAAGVAIVLGWALGGSEEIVRSLAPKSATAPIAIAVAQQIGGLPPLAAVLAIATGITGGVLATSLLDRLRIVDWRIRGLAAGVAAHGIGTARVMALNDTGGAFGSLGMGLCGFVTALLLPLGLALLT